MKKVEVSKEFIIKAHESACDDWKKRIEAQVPEVFGGDELVKGKWYVFRGNPNRIVRCGDVVNERGEGTWDSGTWGTWDMGKTYGPRSLATYEEINNALVKEARKRGFGTDEKEFFKVLVGSHKGKVSRAMGSNCWFEYNEDGFFNLEKTGVMYTIFAGGKWAEFVDTMTMDEAEKELGVKIIV